MSEALTPTGRRKAVEQWPVRVVCAEHVARSVRRITLTAPELGSYVPLGPDEYFGLMVPRAGDRTALRWYSMRALRTGMCELDVDIVVHGTEGPGTTWALTCGPGDEVPLRVGGADYSLPAEGETHLLVADETSLPALASISDAYEAGGRVGTIVAFAETPDADHDTPFTPSFALTHLHRGDARPGDLVIPAVQAAELPTLDGAWLCGESRLATTLRRHATRTLEVPRAGITFSGYWRHS